MKRLFTLLVLFALLLAACGGAADNVDNNPLDAGEPIPVDSSPLDGRWEGTMDIGGTTTPIVVRFSAQTGALMGTLDAADLGIAGESLTNVSQVGDTVTFESPTVGATFSGDVSGDTLSGGVTQAGETGTFTLTRTGDVE